MAITDTDVDDVEPADRDWLWGYSTTATCDWGYPNCRQQDYIAYMHWQSFEGEWMCDVCYRTAQAEYDEWLHAAMYDGRDW